MSDLLAAEFAPLPGERPPEVPTAEAIAAAQTFRQGIKDLLTAHPEGIRPGEAEHKTVILEYVDEAADPSATIVPELDINVDVQQPDRPGAEIGSITVRVVQRNELGRAERFIGYTEMPSGRMVRHEATSHGDLFRGHWTKEVNQAGTDVPIAQAEALGFLSVLQRAQVMTIPVRQIPEPKMPWAA